MCMPRACYVHPYGLWVWRRLSETGAPYGGQRCRFGPYVPPAQGTTRGISIPCIQLSAHETSRRAANLFHRSCGTLFPILRPKRDAVCCATPLAQKLQAHFSKRGSEAPYDTRHQTKTVFLCRTFIDCSLTGTAFAL